MYKVCLLLMMVPGLVRSALAQAISLRIQAHHVQTGERLMVNWQWADSAGWLIGSQTDHIDDALMKWPGRIAYLNLTSPGYRSARLPMHWSWHKSAKLSFLIDVPLIPVDKPSTGQGNVYRR